MIKILGHRGVMGDSARPENSLAALAEGLRQGDGIETDISASADGTAWIVHDVTVRYVPYVFTRSRYMLREMLDARSRSLAAGRRLGQMRDAEIEKLRTADGQALPRLGDLFAMAAREPGKILNLELKGAGAADAAVTAIRAAIAAGQVTPQQIIITSFDAAALHHVRAREPGWRCGLIVLPRGVRGARIYPWEADSAPRYRDFSPATFAAADIGMLRPDFIVTKAADAAGLAAMKAALPGAQLILWSRDEAALIAAAGDRALRPHLAAVIAGAPARIAPRINP